jgi:hypothetical protein
MLLAADAGATVAAPTPTVIAVAATAPASFVIFTPGSPPVSTWSYTAIDTRETGVETQTWEPFA